VLSAVAGFVEQGHCPCRSALRLTYRDAFRDGRGDGERREFGDQLMERPGGLGGPGASASGAWRREERLLSAGGVGHVADQFADLLADLDDAGVPAGRGNRLRARGLAGLLTGPVCLCLAGAGAVPGLASAVRAVAAGELTAADRAPGVAGHVWSRVS